MIKKINLVVLCIAFVLAFAGCTALSIDKSKYTQIKFNEMYETNLDTKEVSQKLKLF